MDAASADRNVKESIDALKRGAATEALDLLDPVVRSTHASVWAWLLHAQACRAAGDGARERSALEAVLAAEPRNLPALLMMGENYARAGDLRAGASFARNALDLASNAGAAAKLVEAALKRAEALCERAQTEFSDHLDRALADAGFARTPGDRIDEALDLLAGKKQVYFQQPSSFFLPRLPHIQFYAREDFDWAPALEAHTPAIREELLALLKDEAGFQPYVESDPARPANLDPMVGDPSWSAFHLLTSGEPIAGNVERCPRTMAALAEVPLAMIRGRSPMALFSLLRPGAKIAPHNGLINTRLICHLPIIVPPDCAIRVGNEVRAWEEGKLLLFDDSIEHEAWNRSEQTRVVLIFEIWRPELSERERRLLTAMYEAITDFVAPNEV